MNVEDMLKQRGSTHGEFADNARIMQKLKDAIRAEPGYAKLDATKREALDMILHKVGRVVSGNPEEPDHWLDIEGYARLARDRVVKPAVLKTYQADLKNVDPTDAAEIAKRFAAIR